MIWIVRDSDEETGAPMPYVSVWSERPKRWAMSGGHVWLSRLYARGEPFSGWLGSLFLPDAIRILVTLPDDDRQVVVMDRDPKHVESLIDAARPLIRKAVR